MAITADQFIGDEGSQLHKIESIEKALLVAVDAREDREAEANFEELRLLAESAGALVADEMRVRRSRPDPRLVIGKGNAEEAFLRVQDTGATLMIVGEDLTPSQQRNLEDASGARVVDRTQLILDIFAQRARTSEGKLQVELAQLEYLLPRLTGKGTAMSRLGGSSAGGVATRGPGETKLETDRKRVRKRIAVLRQELEDVVRHRAVQNKSRRDLMMPSAALVGYTSAGKSTLLNLLSGAEVAAHKRLFETLDPTTRRVDLEGGVSFLLSDTVGFISRLPHHLVAAFRATLEEVVDADFLVHVVDASHHYADGQREAVNDVLERLGAADKPTITVFNKSDRIPDQYELRRTVAQTPHSCYISAMSGDGREYLEDLLRSTISRLMSRVSAVIPYERGDLLAMCHDRGRVIETEYLPHGVRVDVELTPDLAPRLAAFAVEGSDE